MVYRKAWEVQYQRDRARGQTRYVDAKPTRSRLAELTAAHVPVRALGRACGLSDTGVKAILAGTSTQVQQETATRVARICLRDIYSDQATGHVPKIGAVRRVHALMAMGWSHHQLEAAGVPNTARLLSGPGHLVTVERWREVCEVYDRLSMTPGPSPETRGWARTRGYAPPLAWSGYPRAGIAADAAEHGFASCTCAQRGDHSGGVTLRGHRSRASTRRRCCSWMRAQAARRLSCRVARRASPSSISWRVDAWSHRR